MNRGVATLLAIRQTGRMVRAAALAAALLVAAPGWACSLMPGYRVLTALELAERADTVVIAEVVGGATIGPDASDRLGVRPTLLLKGAELPSTLAIRGYLERPDMRATRSDPAALREPNPDALMGGCTRYLFAKGMKLVLFFKRDGSELRFLDYPFARVSEDVRSDDARWVKAVRVYIDIARLPKAARRTALIARRDTLRAAKDADSQAIATDIDRELFEERGPLLD
ncbi:hypothetical protein AB2M62_19515 [Sphingomonas sp. MMS12-HWE2-04]|uniref:hypothetical protein n=1 Tax=Sphingomonas sp. MMS12-HWE2-04 TaxID=3234199 RepID=UPI00384ADAEF